MARFERGEVVEDLHEAGPTQKRGTKVRFHADPLIYGDVRVDFDILGSRFRELSYLTEGVNIKLTDLRPIAADLDLTLPQLALAWVLQNRNVSAAFIGATRGSQVHDNVKASGVELPAEVMARIDAVLADVIVTDPAKTVSPNPRP